MNNFLLKFIRIQFRLGPLFSGKDIDNEMTGCLNEKNLMSDTEKSLNETRVCETDCVRRTPVPAPRQWTDRLEPVQRDRHVLFVFGQDGYLKDTPNLLNYGHVEYFLIDGKLIPIDNNNR